MKTLVTFAGQFGDILWSLPTAREIAGNNKVDFGIMPGFKSLISLIEVQPYINKVFAIENWIETGRPHGCQPWEAPYIAASKITTGLNNEVRAEIPYDKVYHLTYRTHPTKDQPLIDFIASQQGIKLTNPIPFINLRNSIIGDTDDKVNLIKELSIRQIKPTVVYAFNDSMVEYKAKFLNDLKSKLLDVYFMNITNKSWLDAAYLIQNSLAFVGCRSSNYVLACGLGQKVFVYEPNIARSKFGPWGTTFTCPYADETEVKYDSMNPIVDYVKSKLVEVVK